MEQTTKRSNSWYILPIILGLLGGVIAYFVLRKSDPSKAKICLIVGLGVTVTYFVVLGAVGSTSDDTPELTEKSQERDIQATRDAEEAQYQAELERQRAAEEAQYQAELERQRAAEEASASKFDPIIVDSAKKNIPDMQALPKGVLEQCLAVNSYSEYQIFVTALVLLEDDMTQTLEGINVALTYLEIQGYDKHLEVGPLISETRQILSDTADCLTTLGILYGN